MKRLVQSIPQSTPKAESTDRPDGLHQTSYEVENRPITSYKLHFCVFKLTLEQGALPKINNMMWYLHADQVIELSLYTFPCPGTEMYDWRIICFPFLTSWLNAILQAFGRTAIDVHWIGWKRGVLFKPMDRVVAYIQSITLCIWFDENLCSSHSMLWPFESNTLRVWFEVYWNWSSIVLLLLLLLLLLLSCSNINRPSHLTHQFRSPQHHQSWRPQIKLHTWRKTGHGILCTNKN